MVLCTWIYTFVSYRIRNMKRKDTKSKALSSCFSGKSIVLYLGGSRFKPCLLPFVCTQIFLGYYFHYILILYLRLSFSHLVPIFNMRLYMGDHHPFHIAPSRFRPFHTIFMLLPKIFTTAQDGFGQLTSVH